MGNTFPVLIAGDIGFVWVQEDGVKDITEGKQTKDGRVQVAGVLVTLDTTTVSNVSQHLLINELVCFLLHWDLYSYRIHITLRMGKGDHIPDTYTCLQRI